MLCLRKYIDCQLLVKNYYKHFLTYGNPPAKGDYGKACYEKICLQGHFIDQYTLGWQEN